MTTGFLWHELYAWHDTGTGAWVMPASLTVQPLAHIESAEGKRRIRNLVEVSGLMDQLVQLKPRPATEDEILRLHTREYVDRIKKMSAESGGEAGEETPFGRGSYEIALLSAGGCIVAGSASSATPRSPRCTRVKPEDSRASRSWTGTCTTATAPSTPSTPIRRC